MPENEQYVSDAMKCVLEKIAPTLENLAEALNQDSGFSNATTKHTAGVPNEQIITVWAKLNVTRAAKSHEIRFTFGVGGGKKVMRIEESVGAQGTVNEALDFDEITKEKIEEISFQIKESLARSLAICEELLKEPSFGKKALLEEDFKQEVAFDALLQLLEPALERTAQRFHWKHKEEE